MIPLAYKVKNNTIRFRIKQRSDQVERTAGEALEIRGA